MPLHYAADDAIDRLAAAPTIVIDFRHSAMLNMSLRLSIHFISYLLFAISFLFHYDFRLSL